MTEKRFVYYEHKGADYILDTPNKSLDFIEMLGDCLEAEEIVDLLNELHEENQELKQELHKIYELATVNKVRDIVENVYDDLFYKTSDESDYARTKVLKCLEDIDNLRDDLE